MFLVSAGRRRPQLFWENSARLRIHEGFGLAFPPHVMVGWVSDGAIEGTEVVRTGRAWGVLGVAVEHQDFSSRIWRLTRLG